MAFPVGWLRFAPITIDKTKVSAGVVNFPVLLVENNFPAEMFGSDANSALDGGGDIRFSADALGVNQLPCEVIRFDKTAIKAEVYVKVPSISASVNTVIYVWYAAAGESQPAAADTYGSQSVWDSNFRLSLHMNQDPSGAAPQILDSTQYGLNGTTSGGMLTAALVDASVGKGITFDRVNDHVAFAADSNLNGSSGFTWETVLKPSQISALAEVFAKTSATSGNVGYLLGVYNNKWIAWFGDAAAAYVWALPSVTSASTSRTDHLAVVYDNVGATSLAEPSVKTGHCANIAYGNKIYMFGGHPITSLTAVANVNCYDPSNDTWSAKTAMLTARNGAAAAEVGGVIYVMGGDTGTTTASLKNEAYDVAGNSWTTKTDVPTGHGAAGVAAVAIGGKIYLTNGTTLDEYDPVGNSWAAKAALPSSVGTYPSVCTDGTYMYVIGGYSGGSGSNKIYRYDPVANSWGSQFATAPYTAWAGSAVIYNGYLYYGFGRTAAKPMSSALYKMLLTNQTWTQLPSDSAGGNTLAVGMYSNHLFFLGSRSPGPAETYSDGYNSKFDLTSELWETKAATFKMYLNGALDNWITAPVSIHTSTAIFDVGSYNNGAGNWWGGVIDEIRISDSPRNTSWLVASYNNLMFPTTFAAAGVPTYAPDIEKPVITSFEIPATTTSLDVAITSLAASDNIAVIGYMITESDVAPSAGDPGWSASPPTSYTFTGEGTKTLYSWAKDAAGNVSTSASDSVTITLPVTVSNNCLIAFPDRSLDATFSGGDWLSALPLTNLKDDALATVARSNGLLATATKFDEDLGSVMRVRLITIPRHNFSISATIRIRLGTDATFATSLFDSGTIDVYPNYYDTAGNDWGHPVLTNGKPSTAFALAMRYPIFIVLPAALDVRYARCEIVDTSNPAGYVQLSRFILAPAIQPRLNLLTGGGTGYETDTTMERSKGGVAYFDRSEPRRRQAFTLKGIPEEQATGWYLEMQRYLGIDGEFFFVYDPTNTCMVTRQRSFLATMRQLSPLENPSLDYHTAAFEVVEKI